MTDLDDLDHYLVHVAELQAENAELKARVQELEAEYNRLKAQIGPLRMDTLRVSLSLPRMGK